MLVALGIPERVKPELLKEVAPRAVSGEAVVKPEVCDSVDLARVSERGNGVICERSPAGNRRGFSSRRPIVPSRRGVAGSVPLGSESPSRLLELPGTLREGVVTRGRGGCVWLLVPGWVRPCP
jgi:hypothetical protein